MKIFIDLGAYTGDSLTMALNLYDGVNVFYAFEPLSTNFKELELKFGGRKDIILINAAVDIATGEGKLYLHRRGWLGGASLCEDKKSITTDKFEIVKILDFSAFIIENFKPTDEIILKMDVEGKEYDILEKMIRDGSIKYIKEIYCEWHYSKIGMDFMVHHHFVRQLRKCGINLTGFNIADEFLIVANTNKKILGIKRYWIFYTYLFKKYIRENFPIAHSMLKRMTAFLRRN